MFGLLWSTGTSHAWEKPVPFLKKKRKENREVNNYNSNEGKELKERKRKLEKK